MKLPTLRGYTVPPNYCSFKHKNHTQHSLIAVNETNEAGADSRGHYASPSLQGMAG